MKKKKNIKRLILILGSILLLFIIFKIDFNHPKLKKLFCSKI